MKINSNGPLLILGKNGQVGSALAKILFSEKSQGSFWDGIILQWDSQEANFLNPDKILQKLDQYKPSLIINASAYTAVDSAESDTAKALQINALTPGEIAKWCHRNNCVFIHYSTDYVFSNLTNSESPFSETDSTGPINFYGKSKLIGEQLIEASECQYFIFRTSWVYSAVGVNFVKTILKLACEKEKINIVCDQWGSPTYAGDIAQATMKIILQIKNRDIIPCGIFHMSGNGYTNWYEFALGIIQTANQLEYSIKENKIFKLKEINPIPSSQYPTPAQRPLNSRLDNNKLKSVFQITLPKWQDSLVRCMKEIINH